MVDCALQLLFGLACSGAVIAGVIALAYKYHVAMIDVSSDDGDLGVVA